MKNIGEEHLEVKAWLFIQSDRLVQTWDLVTSPAVLCALQGLDAS